MANHILTMLTRVASIRAGLAKAESPSKVHDYTRAVQGVFPKGWKYEIHESQHPELGTWLEGVARDHTGQEKMRIHGVDGEISGHLPDSNSDMASDSPMFQRANGILRHHDQKSGGRWTTNGPWAASSGSDKAQASASAAIGKLR